MMQVRPGSPSADPAPGWSPQPQGPSPAKRRRLHEPACHEPLAQPDMEEPAQPDSEELTSVVFLAPGCAMQLQLEGVDLLVEPEPTSALQVSLPGHTLILVPEGLQSSYHLGQPESSASPQEAYLLEVPQDNLVVLQQESCEYILDSSSQEDTCDEDEDLGFLAPWMDPPAGQAWPWPQEGIPEPYLLVPSSNAESYLLRTFPSSPLQPLPLSPSPSPPEQQSPPYPPHTPRAPSKTRRRLFCD
ncbi:hypothetical protein STEG23_030932 [Scotinomys teguina]